MMMGVVAVVVALVIEQKKVLVGKFV